MGEVMDKLAKELGAGQTFQPRNPESPADEVDRAYRKGLTTRAYAEGAGLLASRSQAPASPQQNVEPLTKMMTEILTSALEALKSGGGHSEYLQHLEGDLKDIKQGMQSGDPLETFLATQERIDHFASVLKERLGMHDLPRSTGADLPQLIQLETLKQQHEEKMLLLKQQHEERMTADTRAREGQMHAWEQENERWKEEFEVRKAEIAQSSGIRNEALGHLRDLASSIMAGVDSEMGGPSGAPSHPESNGVKFKTAPTFECTECHTPIMVPEGAKNITCGKCGMTFDAKE